MGSLISSRRIYQQGTGKSKGRRFRGRSPDVCHQRSSINRPVLRLQVKPDTLNRHGIQTRNGVSEFRRSTLRRLAHSGVPYEKLLSPPEESNACRVHTPPPVRRHNLIPPTSLPPHTLPTPSLPLPPLPRRSHSLDALDSMIIIQYVENDSNDSSADVSANTANSDNHLARLSYARMGDVQREEEHFGNITITRTGSPPIIAPSTSLGMINVFQRIQDHTHPPQGHTHSAESFGHTHQPRDYTHKSRGHAHSAESFDHTHQPQGHSHSAESFGHTHQPQGHAHSAESFGHTHQPRGHTHSAESFGHTPSSGEVTEESRSLSPNENDGLLNRYSPFRHSRSTDALPGFHSRRSWKKFVSVSEEEVCSGMEWSLGESIMRAMSQHGLTLFDIENPTSASEHEVNKAWPELKDKMKVWKSQHSLDKLGGSSTSEDTVFRPHHNNSITITAH